MSLQRSTPPLILASQSAARADLLRRTGLVFATVPSHVNEAEIKAKGRAEGSAPDEIAVFLARLKAVGVARKHPDALVIGADQILISDGAWFDKPESTEDARRQLQQLRGRDHDLITAVVCHRGEEVIWTHVSRPRLRMRDFSDAFLSEYIGAQGDEVTTTVGAYRLEGLGLHLFDQVSGEFAAILGLPMLPLLRFLRQHGVLLP